jgi:glycosyltransferase involved in cell wall biosynthesis
VNKKLAICITTYKRPNVVNDVLENIIKYARLYNVAVYLNDNSSEDGTNSVLEKHKKNYEFFFPKINKTNIGFDKNFEDCIKRPDQDYIWGMADYSFINSDAIPKILELIDTCDFDAILLNNFNRVNYYVPDNLTSIEEVANTIGWQITLLDSIIWSRRTINNSNFERYYGSLFAYYGALMEYLCSHSCNVRWLNSSLVEKCHPAKQSLWLPKTVDTWCLKWATMVLSLPFAFSYNDKLKLIRSHSIQSKIFTLSSLISLRQRKFLNMRMLWENRNALFTALPFSYIARIGIAAATPVLIAKFIYLFKKKSKTENT